MPDALARVVRDVRAELMVLSQTDESFCDLSTLVDVVRRAATPRSSPSTRTVTWAHA